MLDISSNIRNINDNNWIPLSGDQINNLVPVNGHVVVKLLTEKERSGIILPMNAQESKHVGQVISAAKSADPQKLIEVAKDDIVYFSWGGTKLEKIIDLEGYMTLPYEKIVLVYKPK